MIMTNDTKKAGKVYHAIQGRHKELEWRGCTANNRRTNYDSALTAKRLVDRQFGRTIESRETDSPSDRWYERLEDPFNRIPGSTSFGSAKN